MNFGAPALNPTPARRQRLARFLAEALGAFALIWAVMGTAVNPAAPKGVAGIAIGGALGFSVMIFGPATGGSFNPARWLGPSLTSGHWTDWWMYILAPDRRRRLRRLPLPQGDGARRPRAAGPAAVAR